MPIYRYECQDCGAVVERIQDYDDDAPACPENVTEEECGDVPNAEPSSFERVIGMPNAHFKGEGFYVNDADDAENPASS